VVHSIVFPLAFIATPASASKAAEHKARPKPARRVALVYHQRAWDGSAADHWHQQGTCLHQYPLRRYLRQHYRMGCQAWLALLTSTMPSRQDFLDAATPMPAVGNPLHAAEAVVSIIAAKSSGRYRIQSDDFASLGMPLTKLVEALHRHHA
jgi:hypothetical protein